MASTTTAPAPQPTTFPRQTFAKLSPHPFLLANLAPADPSHTPARTNGRSQTEARSVNVNTGSLSHAHGSAVVRCGDTTVICGVRGEILPVANIPNYRVVDDVAIPVADHVRRERSRRELRDYDLLVPNIELATGCAPQFLPGVPPTTLAQTLSSRIYSLLHAAQLVDIEDLRIVDTAAAAPAEGDEDQMGEEAADDENTRPTKAYWALFIDVLFISFDGNAFDVAWTAVLAALRDTKLPPARWDEDREAVLCSQRTPPRQLTTHGFPVACTAAVVRRRRDDPDAAGDQYWVLVDPDRVEEELCDESVSVVVDAESDGDTKVLSILKTGGTAAGLEFIMRLTTVAEKRWREVRDSMK